MFYYINMKVFKLISKSFSKKGFKDIDHIKNHVNKDFNINDKNKGKTRQEIYQGYTKHEFDELIRNKIEDKDEINIFEIATESYNKAKGAKKWSLYFNLPLSVTLTILSEFSLVNSIKFKELSPVIFMMDYSLFIFALFTLNGLRNIVITCDYIIKDNSLVFTKLDYFNKPYNVTEKVEDLERVYDNIMTPFLSLRNKHTGNKYSMTGTGYFNDFKLYNFLFPHKLYSKDLNETETNEGNNTKNSIKVAKKDESKLWDN